MNYQRQIEDQVDAG